MVKTKYPEIIKLNKPHFLFPHRIRKIKDTYLVISDHGGWVGLTKEEYISAIRNEMTSHLFSILESRGIIATQDNIDSIVNAYKNRYHFLFNGTTLHIIIPTLRCNHQCVYCHSASKTPEKPGLDLDEKTADKILDCIFQSPNDKIKIEFQGGEGALNKKIVMYVVNKGKALALKHKKDVKFVLVTNLTMMDDDFLNFLIIENVGMTTSLDGPEYIHNKNRKYVGGQGTYKDVVKWINKIKEKNKSVGMLMVTTKYSLPYWKEIIDEYVRIGVKTIQLKYLNRLGFAENEWEEIGYTPEEFIEFWKNGMDYIIELNKKGIPVRERISWLILKKILTPYEPGFLDFRSPCGVVGGQLSYNHNGDIFSCDEGRSSELFKLGNVKDMNYTDLFKTKMAQSLISSSILENYLCDACAYKPFCGVCPIINHAEQGNIIPKLGSNSRCKINKSQIEYVFEKLLFDIEASKILTSWVGK